MQTRSTFRPVRSPFPRLRAPLLVVAGAVVGIMLTTAAAAGATAATDSVPPAAQTLMDVRADANGSLGAARAALGDVDALAADIESSGLELDGETAVDTSTLDRAVDRLSDIDTLPLMLLPELADDADAAAAVVQQRLATVRERFETAVAEKAAADAAAEAAARAAAEAAALAAANTPDGAKATAQQLMAGYGWGADQFTCLSSLWQKESSWNYQAYNAGSGATGIPQALPGSKMASAGADWQTSAATQIAWGLDYIARAYGSPCAAWGHSQATNWY